MSALDCHAVALPHEIIAIDLSRECGTDDNPALLSFDASLDDAAVADLIATLQAARDRLHAVDPRQIRLMLEGNM